jgi:hypothetical protein
MKMEATCSSETSVDFKQSARLYIPEDLILYIPSLLWQTFFPVKFIVPQLVKEFLLIWDPKVQYRVHRSSPRNYPEPVSSSLRLHTRFLYVQFWYYSKYRPTPRTTKRTVSFIFFDNIFTDYAFFILLCLLNVVNTSSFSIWSTS